eukprot:1789252-Rhodomonas_salina.11
MLVPARAAYAIILLVPDNVARRGVGARGQREVLAAPYAMSGTDVAYAAMHLPCDVQYRLTWRMLCWKRELQALVRPDQDSTSIQFKRYGCTDVACCTANPAASLGPETEPESDYDSADPVLCPYGPATKCPVLTSRMVLPGH